MSPFIEIKDLTCVYPKKGTNDRVVALDRFSARIEEGTFAVVVGYSGCGKTTLLRCIAGLQEYEGTILLQGRDAKETDPGRQGIALVSQQYVLYPHLTVFDNIAFPLLTAKVGKREIVDRVCAVAQDLRLTPCLTRKPKQISGGQQQRVALARALVKKPSLCLLDEPFSNVDAQMRTEQRHYLKKALKKAGCTVIYVTHDIREAMAMADLLIVMDEGRVSICGSPSDVFASDDPVMRSLTAE